MRITNNMMIDRSLRDINANLNRLDKTQRDISTGKRIHRPSDDPTAMARALVLRNNLAQNEQYKKNVEYAEGHLAVTDSTLGQVTDALQRLRQLAVQASSGHLRDEDKGAIATEVDQIREELRALGNTQFNGRYIFGGIKTDQVVFPSDPPGWPEGSGVQLGPNDRGRLSMEVAPKITLDYSVTGVEVFGDTMPPSTNNIFSVIETFVGYLDGTLTPPGGTGSGTSNSAISEESLRDIGNFITSVGQVRTQVGGKMNRVELAKTRMEEFNLSMNSLLQETEDTDVAEASLKLNQYEATFRAALSVGGRAMPLSLVDFLR